MGRHSSYHVFDILWLNGKKTTELPLEERRDLLKTLKFTAPIKRVTLLDGDEPWERARRDGWEGVIAKRRGSPYEHRRSKHWLKMKIEASQELVVGGFTDPQGGRVGPVPRSGDRPPPRCPPAHRNGPGQGHRRWWNRSPRPSGHRRTGSTRAGSTTSFWHRVPTYP